MKKPRTHCAGAFRSLQTISLGFLFLEITQRHIIRDLCHHLHLQLEELTSNLLPSSRHLHSFAEKPSLEIGLVSDVESRTHLFHQVALTTQTLDVRIYVSSDENLKDELWLILITFFWVFMEVGPNVFLERWV